MFIVNILAPVFLIVAVGAVLRRTGFIGQAVFRDTNRLVYWVGLPCLLFVKTAQPMEAALATEALHIVLLLLVGTIVCVVAGYLVGPLIGVPKRSLGAFVQGAFRGNLAYTGLPVILYAVASGSDTAAVEQLAVLAIAPIIPVYNAFAVLVLVVGQEKDDARLRQQVTAIVAGVVTNPLVLSCVVGIGYSFTGWPLPLAVSRTCEGLGGMSLALALLSIGAILDFRQMHGQAFVGTIASLIKIVLAPVVGWLLGRHLGLSPEHLRIAMVYLACPTAVMSYVMAEQLHNDGELAAAIVMISTLLSAAAMAAVLWATST